MKAAGTKIPAAILLGTAILDGVNMLAWMQSKDGGKGKNRPKSVLRELAGDSTGKTKGFETAEEFEAARAKILKKR